MPRNVVFVAPFPAETTLRFVRAAKKLDDVRLLGVVHTPPSGDDAHLFDDLVRVTDPLSGQDVLDGVEVLRRRHGQPYRIAGILEALMVQIAEARARFDVPGTKPDVAELFRDKARMKVALREAGLPVARHRLIGSERDAHEFAEQVGFPMILKPPAGMGAKATFRVSSRDALLRAIAGMRVSSHSPVLAEEMLTGREFSFETVTTGGVPRVSSFSEYLPGCLEVLENAWIQWACVLPREVDGAPYDAARAMGEKAVRALGLDSGFTHMEWFERSDGSLAIGEIAQRPPGANITRMTGLAHDIDAYRAWARAVIDDELDAPWERKYAVGCAYVRGMGHGRIASVSGVHETYEAVGKWVAEAKLPTIGAPKSDGYEGDGYVIVRHESTEMVRRLVTKIVETMKVHYVA
ncbi:Carbamoylphosphate synthase large subunit protein [Labilithrix luteola]|uniref:Carbamoylphosphate synthase large subunit protein n=1 Tax=Labilithrix luteola TaxID=1391654 RepID=A0A0K1QF67_9BACT|nr:ATP-grasp domain-containing protein [Labilithrix luteola]AKV04080.1 Carbamoylphosphate synthase large subunit protein [Labilithrix luteola]